MLLGLLYIKEECSYRQTSLTMSPYFDLSYTVVLSRGANDHQKALNLYFEIWRFFALVPEDYEGSKCYTYTTLIPHPYTLSIEAVLQKQRAESTKI